MSNLNKNQRGFALIQVIIAGSLLSIISLGVARLITNQSQNISYLEDRLSHQNLKKYFTDTVKSSCLKQLENLSLNIDTNLSNPIKLENIDGQILFDPDSTDQGKFEKLNIDGVNLKNIDVVGSKLEGKVNISMYPKRQRQGFGPSEMQTISADLNVKIDNLTDRKIVSCGFSSTGSGGLEGTWVNVNTPSDSHADTCATVGLAPHISFQLGICASGEVRPRFGEGAEDIDYKHGKWGGRSIVGGDLISGTSCYNHGQKQDGDGTDQLVAYLCN